MSRPTGLKRLGKFGMSRRVESSKDQESLGAPEDASKQGRSIEDIDADVDVTLVDETQERQDDDLMFDTIVLEDDEMPVEAKVDGKDEQSTKPDDSTADEADNTASVDDSVVPTTKAAKPKVVLLSKDKGKGIMIEPEVPLKKKDQIALDEQITRDIQAKLDAKLLEDQKLARKQEEEANIALIEAQEKRNRLPTKKLFDKEMKRVNIFMAMGSEVQKSKEKKVEVEKEKESEEVDEYDEAELKKLLVIKKDEDIAIDAIPIATKLPVIIDYKLHKEGMLVHYQLIRADGSSKRYSLMIRMLQGIEREDLEAIWRIVKAKYGDTRPDNEFERVLWGDLKVMFEPDKRSDVWRILQGYRVTI
ncbi:hypothetical protein Tco_1010441 [Tanacetum coccineum]